MAKHLLIPKFFLTLTCADQVEWINYDYFKADLFTYFNGRYLENVLLGKEEKIIVVNGPLGKAQYHATCVELQVRGSPHIHSSIWILNAPKSAKSTKL